PARAELGGDVLGAGQGELLVVRRRPRRIHVTDHIDARGQAGLGRQGEEALRLLRDAVEERALLRCEERRARLEEQLRGVERSRQGLRERNRLLGVESLVGERRDAGQRGGQGAGTLDPALWSDAGGLEHTVVQRQGDPLGGVEDRGGPPLREAW